MLSLWGTEQGNVFFALTSTEYVLVLGHVVSKKLICFHLWLYLQFIIQYYYSDKKLVYI
jgi:hypothetical protein